MAKKLKELNKIHREAIRLRYEGNTQEEIVEKLAALGLKTTINTIEAGLGPVVYLRSNTKNIAANRKISKPESRQLCARGPSTS